LRPTTIAFSVTAAPPKDTPAGEQRFRELYKELVETNTQLSNGNCTLAAERMVARLKAAGLPESDLHLIVPPGHEKEGGLVAVYPAAIRNSKRSFCSRTLMSSKRSARTGRGTPFTLVEENGSFYARGAMDDKAEAAIWTDLLIRYHSENYRPRRTLKVALTCGERGAPFNLAKWLTENRRTSSMRVCAQRRRLGRTRREREPGLPQRRGGREVSTELPARGDDPGGHSSRPVKDTRSIAWRRRS